jgi:hypothetical protein
MQEKPFKNVNFAYLFTHNLPSNGEWLMFLFSSMTILPEYDLFFSTFFIPTQIRMEWITWHAQYH